MTSGKPIYAARICSRNALLRFTRRVVIKIIQSRFANANNFGMRRQGDDFGGRDYSSPPLFQPHADDFDGAIDAIMG